MLRIIVITLFTLVLQFHALILEGEVSTAEEWKFIARFCYLTKSGLIEYTFEYPADYCCLDAILYYDTQWKDVYPQPSKSCLAKHRVADPTKSQILTLATYNPGCHMKSDKKGKGIIFCSDYRQFSSSRPRWWYFVISHCGFERGMKLKYTMKLTNGNTFWTRHFSADEQNILETDIAFACIDVVLLALSFYIAYLLSKQQLFHTTFKLYLWALFFEVLSIIVNIIYYVDYGKNGKPRKGTKNIGRGCHCISDTILVVFLVLLGKGWTVTRARISPGGQIKLSVFCTLYGVAYVALFIYEARAFDPGKVLYIYESPAGIGICLMKVIAWFWFCYGIFFTLKNFERKRSFYYPFFVFYTLWFISGPVLVLVATKSIEPHKREQIMNGVDRAVAFCAFSFFLILTRPSKANNNFPYHVRTTQIGITDDDGSNLNLGRCVYKADSEQVELSRQIASLFTVSTGGNQPLRGSNESSALFASGSRSDGVNNPGFTERKESPPNYKEAIEASAPPPQYDLLQYSAAAGATSGNFVNAFGDVLQRKQTIELQQKKQQHLQRQQEQLQQQEQSQRDNDIPEVVIRTTAQMTSLFKAKQDLSINPELTREPSPCFLIPEPPLDQGGHTSPPPAPTTTSRTLSPPLFSDHSNIVVTPPPASPIKTNKKNVAHNESMQSADKRGKVSIENENTKSRRDRSKTFAIENSTLVKKEIIGESNSTILDISNNNNNNNDSLDNNNESKETSINRKSKKRAKSSKGGSKRADDDTEETMMPRALQPITGLNRGKLPPLRGNILPPLK